MADSEISTAKQEVFKNNLDSADKYSPVTIKKVKINEDEYGSKEISITVLNSSKKRIDGIKLHWVLYNNFGDVIDEYGNNGISQDILSPNKKDTYSWDIYSSPATKAEAYVYQVHFTDGTRWDLNN